MSYKNNPIYTKGSAMLIAVIFFLAISLTLLTGVSSPVLKEVKIANDLMRSKQSFFSAESGTEDVVYRLKNAKEVSSIENLELFGYTILTTIADVLGGKTILSESDWGGYTRKVATKVATGSGVAFNYGVQTGNGGFQMSNGAGVIGNVYSNGDIIGVNTSYVTGSAVAANSAALNADQVNDTPEIPPNSVVFGDSNATQDFAQSFEVSEAGPVNKVSLYIRKVGSPSNATVRIVTNSGGSPSNSTIASGSLSALTVTGTYGWIDVVFTTNPELTPETTYWLVIDAGTDSSRYYTIAANSDFSGGIGKKGRYGSSWSSVGYDGYFKLFLGGLTSKIENIIVGEDGVGLAHAHTVTGSTVAGSLYCQEGNGNNKTCDTSLPDPAPQGFPVSDANIAEWKAGAEAGGVIMGDYAPVVSPTTIGPTKITGDLNLINNQILILSGVLWVEGNISISNGAQIRLSSDYGANSGMVIADGRVSISNNAQFSGSGQSGSYIMLLTTSDCPLSSSCGGDYAIRLSNNAGAVILNAQKGTLYLSNGAGAKEATAHKIIMSNNSTIEYESGLAAPSFSTGPSGGWNISSWIETQ